jgi:hypothetical protein
MHITAVWRHSGLVILASFYLHTFQMKKPQNENVNNLAKLILGICCFAVVIRSLPLFQHGIMDMNTARTCLS